MPVLTSRPKALPKRAAPIAGAAWSLWFVTMVAVQEVQQFRLGEALQEENRQIRFAEWREKPHVPHVTADWVKGFAAMAVVGVPALVWRALHPQMPIDDWFFICKHGGGFAGWIVAGISTRWVTAIPDRSTAELLEKEDDSSRRVQATVRRDGVLLGRTFGMARFSEDSLFFEGAQTSFSFPKSFVGFDSPGFSESRLRSNEGRLSKPWVFNLDHGGFSYSLELRACGDRRLEELIREWKRAKDSEWEHAFLPPFLPMRSRERDERLNQFSVRILSGMVAIFYLVTAISFLSRGGAVGLSGALASCETGLALSVSMLAFSQIRGAGYRLRRLRELQRSNEFVMPLVESSAPVLDTAEI